MKSIQDRIIEIIKKHNNDVMSFPTPRELLNANKRLEQFLLTSIKEVEEETKCDVLNKLHAMVCDLATDKGKDLAKEDCLELIRYQIERIYGKKLLSITNNEK